MPATGSESLVLAIAIGVFVSGLQMTATGHANRGLVFVLAACLIFLIASGHAPPPRAVVVQVSEIPPILIFAVALLLGLGGSVLSEYWRDTDLKRRLKKLASDVIELHLRQQASGGSDTGYRDPMRGLFAAMSDRRRKIAAYQLLLHQSNIDQMVVELWKRGLLADNKPSDDLREPDDIMQKAEWLQHLAQQLPARCAWLASPRTWLQVAATVGLSSLLWCAALVGLRL